MAEILHQFIGSLSPLFTGFYTSQAVQDFFHQQYVVLQPSILMINPFWTIPPFSLKTYFSKLTKKNPPCHYSHLKHRHRVFQKNGTFRKSTKEDPHLSPWIAGCVTWIPWIRIAPGDGKHQGLTQFAIHGLLKWKTGMFKHFHRQIRSCLLFHWVLKVRKSLPKFHVFIYCWICW